MASENGNEMQQSSPKKDCSLEIAYNREASVVASTVLSVIRDRSISSAYGLFLSLLQEDGLPINPEYSALFSDKMSERLKVDVERRLGTEALDSVLYGGEGDLLGQLSRLLIVGYEVIVRQGLDDCINAANKKIGALEFPHWSSDGNHIKHLRNAIVHWHFSLFVDDNNWSNTRIVFWDQKPQSGEKVAEYTFTNLSINQVIDILLDDLCLGYLKEVGWVFGK